jgi:hypothetical protein
MPALAASSELLASLTFPGKETLLPAPVDRSPDRAAN